MPRDTALGHPISPHQKSLYAVGVAFAAYGTAVLPPEGNGLIADVRGGDRARDLAARTSASASRSAPRT